MWLVPLGGCGQVAIDTEPRRNSALLDECGVLLPDGLVDAADRQTLVGDYLPAAAAPPGAVVLDEVDF
jgi:hypothetical protein